MTTSTIPHPPIVERDQWITDRQTLLAEEKELTKHYDRIAATYASEAAYAVLAAHCSHSFGKLTLRRRHNVTNRHAQY